MRRFLPLFVLGSLFFLSDVYSQVRPQGVALALRAGTMGPGVELVVPVGGKLNIRGGGSYLSMSRNTTVEDEDTDVEFNADVTWGAMRGLVDWHPFSSGFRLTGGGYIDLRDITASGKPLSSVTINDKEFAPERLGSLSVNYNYEQTISPYLGIGFGDAARGARVGFLLDLGMVYVGSPTLDMTGTGMIAPTANWDTTLTEGLESFKWMPIVSLGLSVRIL